MKKLTYPLSWIEPEEKEGENLVSVYKTARGKYFIIRISKKTGKNYRQYISISSFCASLW